jgi:hypothetical protein
MAHALDPAGPALYPSPVAVAMEPVRVCLLEMGPGPVFSVRPVGRVALPWLVRPRTVFGLRGPWSEALLRDLLEDVSTVVVRVHGACGDGRMLVDVLPDLAEERRGGQ